MLVHSSIDRHLDCFLQVAVVDNAVINIWVQVSVETYVSISLGYLPKTGIAGPYSNSVQLSVDCLTVFHDNKAMSCCPQNSWALSHTYHSRYCQRALMACEDSVLPPVLVK